jgi:hypothetical protein
MCASGSWYNEPNEIEGEKAPMATRTLEDRLTIVEQELERLKRQIQADKPQDTEPRWKQIIGVFKDCPEFEEAVRLGREWRESQRMEYDEDDAETAEAGHASA